MVLKGVNSGYTVIIFGQMVLKGGSSVDNTKIGQRLLKSQLGTECKNGSMKGVNWVHNDKMGQMVLKGVNWVHNNKTGLNGLERSQLYTQW